jgi:hypothetical protein
MTIFNLECEDASHLGGPMGTEHTTLVFTQPCRTLERAKEFAENYATTPRPATWQQDSRGNWSWDAVTHIFSIKALVVY